MTNDELNKAVCAFMEIPEEIRGYFLPRKLRDTAVEFFLLGDIDSPLSLEVKRQLKHIEEKGCLDVSD